MSDALRSVFAEFGFKADTRTLDRVEARTKAVTKGLGGATTAATRASAGAEGFAEAAGTINPTLGRVTQLLSGAQVRMAGLVGVLAAAAASVQRFTAAFVDDATALRRAAEVARTSAATLQAVGLAAASAGADTEGAAKGMEALGEGLRSIAEHRGGGTVGAQLYRLGVHARDASGRVRDSGEVLGDVAEQLQRVESPIRRARIAQGLFGSGWRDMLRTLEGGREGLRRHAVDLQRLGGGITPEATEATRELTRQQARASVALDSVRSVVAVALLPVVSSAVQGFAEFAGWFSRMTRGSDLVKVALQGIGVVLGGIALRVLVAAAPVLALVGALGLLALAVDDVRVFLRGGNSVLGEFLDRMGGAGHGEVVARRLRTAWEGVSLAFSDVRDVASWLGGVMSRTVDAATEGLAQVSKGFAEVRAELGAEWTALQGWVTSVSATLAAVFVRPFLEMWTPVQRAAEDMFRAVGERAANLARSLGLDALARQVESAMQPATNAVRGAAASARGTADYLAGAAPAPGSQARRLAGLGADLLNPGAMLAEWHDLLGSLSPSSPRSTAPMTAPLRPGAGARTSVTNLGGLTVNLPASAAGADPRALARAVSAEVGRELQRQRDNAHPQDVEE